MPEPDDISPGGEANLEAGAGPGGIEEPAMSQDSPQLAQRRGIGQGGRYADLPNILFGCN
jgi:hypothetical protein